MAGYPGPERREREGKNSSDETTDSGYYTAPTDGGQITTIETWLAGREQFRRAAPALVRPFPLRRSPCNPRIAKVYKESVEARTHATIQQYHLENADISLHRQYGPNEASDSKSLNSLVIETTTEDPRAMEAAAIEIYRHFKIFGDISYPNIEVEVRNKLKMKANISLPLSNDEQSLQALRRVKDKIFAKTEEIAHDWYTSIAFHNRIPRYHRGQPAQPSILVYFAEGSMLDFDGFELALLDILSKDAAEVKLEILQGNLVFAFGTALKAILLKDAPSKPINGASIGPKGLTDRAGTLGGWFVLDRPGLPPLEVAITCDHVVEDDYVDKNGQRTSEDISPSDKTSASQTIVEYPAAFDILGEISRTESYMKTHPEDSDGKALMQKLQEFQKNAEIGAVIARSGLKKNKDGSRVDWALFQANNTFRRNRPSPRSAFKLAIALPGQSELGYKIDENSTIEHTATAEKDTWVAKCGRTSGHTSGTINSMTRRVAWHNQEGLVTDEIEIFGIVDDFCRKGDSGSLVTDAQGNLVGMVIGNDPFQDWDGGLMSAWATIETDIGEVTGGTLKLA